jgi:uncharacterized delta-60 repeat protein
MPRRAAILAVAATAAVAVAAAQAAPRELDTGFGTSGGFTLTPVAPRDAHANAIARLPNGRILVVGASIAGATDHGIAIVRYLADGKPDPSFGGGDGKVGDQPGSGESTAEALAVQPDGKFVVAGATNYPTDPEIFVARYLADGSPDTSFGDGGARIVPVAGDVVASAAGVALQDDGKVVVAGFSVPSEHESNAVVARLTANGDLDSAYGDQGVAVLDLSDAPNHFTVAEDVVIQDGKAVIAGSVERGQAGYSDLMLARLDDAGDLDPAFGSGGVVHESPGGGAVQFYAHALALAGGKLVIAGQRTPADAPGSQYLLARYTADGEPDTTFNPDVPEPGHVVTSAGSDGESAATALAVDPASGKVTITGYAFHDGNRQVLIDRFTAGGVRDPAFVGANGNGGPRLFDASSGPFHENGGSAVALDDRGGTIVAGWGTIARREEFLLARFGDTTPHPNAKPFARIRGHYTVPRKTLATFRGGRSFDTDGDIVRWAWKVGRGHFHDRGPILQHRFGRTGTRTVILRVTDDDGAVAFARFRVKVVSRRG